MTPQVETVSLRTARNATRMLSVQEKAQLISELAHEIAHVHPAAPVTPDGLARFKAFSATFRATYPAANVARQLDADRDARDRAGADGNTDAHP